jgi:lysyl-tRNA synthetase class 1
LNGSIEGDVMDETPSSLTIPEGIAKVIAKFDQQKIAFTVHDVQAELSAARHQIVSRTPAEDFGAWSEVLAFSLTEDGGGAYWGTFFGPLGSGTNADGAQIVFPDIADATADIIMHWKSRARSVSHPLLKARYSDLVWDLTHKVCGERADHKFARMAASAYLSCETPDVLAETIYRFKAVFRAYSLASQLRDYEGIEAAKAAIMRLHRETMASEKPLWWLAFDFCIAGQQRSFIDELEGIVRDLEVVVSRHSSPGVNFDPHAVKGVGKRLVSFYNKSNKHDDVRRIYGVIAKAQEHFASMGDAMLASIILQEAIDAYKAAGKLEDADRLRILMQQKIRDAQDSMQEISHEFTITKEDMDAFVAAIVDDDPGVTFVRLASQFLCSRKEQIKKKDSKERKRNYSKKI